MVGQQVRGLSVGLGTETGPGPDVLGQLPDAGGPAPGALLGLRAVLGHRRRRGGGGIGHLMAPLSTDRLILQVRAAPAAFTRRAAEGLVRVIDQFHRRALSAGLLTR